MLRHYALAIVIMAGFSGLPWNDARADEPQAHEVYAIRFAVARCLWARWRREQELGEDAAASREHEQERPACASRCIERLAAELDEPLTEDGSIKTMALAGITARPRLKWGRALTNTPRSSGPVFGVHFN